MRQADVQKVIEIIEQAFGNPPPLEEKELYYNIGQDDFRDVADYYRGKRWREVNFSDAINDHNDDPYALNFFAFPYYLPALMVNALRAASANLVEAGTFIEYLEGALTFSFIDYQFFLDRSETLTPPQRRAVYEWLRTIDELYGGNSVSSVTLGYWKSTS